MTENPLGYEKIPKLLKNFAVPSIVASLVGSIYNIVDQIFIGIKRRNRIIQNHKFRIFANGIKHK